MRELLQVSVLGKNVTEPLSRKSASENIIGHCFHCSKNRSIEGKHRQRNCWWTLLASFGRISCLMERRMHREQCPEGTLLSVQSYQLLKILDNLQQLKTCTLFIMLCPGCSAINLPLDFNLYSNKETVKS